MEDPGEAFGAFLFMLRSDIPMSLEDRVVMLLLSARSTETAFLCDMTFFTDINSRLYNLSANLQGKSQET